MACPVPLNLVCDAVGSATSSAAGGVLSAIAGWVVGGATWLLDELGRVITSTTAVNVRASWFVSHYKLMLGIAAIAAVPMLLLAAVQSLFHQNAGVLVRAAFIHLPLAALLTAAAIQIVQLALEVTDVLCRKVTAGTGGELDRTFHSIGSALSHEPLPLPTFVMTVGALLIVVGAFVLWLELLVRAAAIYAAVFFLPLALASLIWPAVSHWCRRLTETLVALILSKFVIVAVLSLAVGAVSSGGDFSTVLAGGALLLLAAFTPFTLLRLIPLAEVGAVVQLEGARQRVRASWGRAPDSAVGFALRQAREHGAHRETTALPGTPGAPGSGMTVDPGVPGPVGGVPGPVGGAGAASAVGAVGGVGAASAVGSVGGAGAASAVGSVGGAGAASAVGAVGGVGAASAVGGADGPTGLTGGGARARAAAADDAGAETDDAAASGGTAGRAGIRLALGPEAQGWPPPGELGAPPGTIPVWPGSPESVIAALEATRRPHRVEPDGYGGIIPGVPSPLWGGTEPLSRFEPGPRDDWGARDVEDGGALEPSPPPLGPQLRAAPPFIDWTPHRPGSDGSRNAEDPEGGTVAEAEWEPDADWDGE
jgi:type IV secretion system protein TrbL